MQGFGRNYIATGEYIEKEFINKNVRYIAILDKVDNFEDKVYNDFLPIKGVFNELYCKETSKNVKNSKRKKMQEGFYACNTPPYGYKKDPEIKGKLIIDEEPAKVVKKIFELKVSGFTALKIAEQLNKECIPTPSQYLNIKGIPTNVVKIWTRDKINRILSNQVYLGDCVRGKTQVISYKNKKRIYLKRKDFIVVKNTHEAIISRDVYEAVHKKGNFGLTKKVREKIQGKFCDFLYCYYCGKKMEKRIVNGKISVHCKNNRNSHELCDFADNFYYEPIEDLTINQIKRVFRNYLENGNSEKNLIEKERDLKINKLKEQEKQKEAEMRKIAFDISKLYNERLDGKISEDEYKKEYAALTEKRERTVKERENIAREIQIILNKRNDKKRVEEIQSIVECISSDNLSQEDIKKIISKIEVGKGLICIHYNFENIGI